MSFSQKDLDDVYKAASLGTPLGAVAVQLGFSPSEFLDFFYEPDSDLKRYYDAGRLKAEQEVRASIHSLAKNGSQVAQILFQKTIQAADYANLKQSLDEL